MRLSHARLAQRAFCTLCAGALLVLASACGSTDNVPLNLKVDPTLSKDIGQSAFHLSGEFAGSGSSAQQSAVAAWIAGYNLYQPDVTIAYDPSGSGAGVNNFLQGAVVWAASDKPLTAEQRQQSRAVCEGQAAIDLPVYISPLAVLYNLPGLNNGHLQLTSAMIADIFEGRINRWNDTRIKQLNPDIADKLPSSAITPVWRSDKSGTTNSFQSYLAQAAPAAWPHRPQETWPVSRVGQGAKGTSGVVSAISQATGTIGYADAAQSAGFGTVAVSLRAADGSRLGVPPDSTKAANLVEAALSTSGVNSDATGDDLPLSLDYSKDSASVYPITQVSYSIVCPAYRSARISRFVGSWLEFQASAQGQFLASSNSGSAPLPPQLSSRIMDVARRLMEAGQ